MHRTLHSLCQFPDELINRKPIVFAALLLQWWKVNYPHKFVCRSELITPIALADFPELHHAGLKKAFDEAFLWLEDHAFIARHPYDPSRYTLTSKGKALSEFHYFMIHARDLLLPTSVLHSRILESGARAAFVRGDYPSAVFKSLRAVEVSVREAGGFGPEDYGTDLMRQAFHPEIGPLTDKSLVKSEREATAHLFAGAIGMFKNPSSHRDVQYEEDEAVELIMFASRLLKIVGARAAALAPAVGSV